MVLAPCGDVCAVCLKMCTAPCGLSGEREAQRALLLRAAQKRHREEAVRIQSGLAVLGAMRGR